MCEDLICFTLSSDLLAIIGFSSVMRLQLAPEGLLTADHSLLRYFIKAGCQCATSSSARQSVWCPYQPHRCYPFAACLLSLAIQDADELFILQQAKHTPYIAMSACVSTGWR